MGTVSLERQQHLQYQFFPHGKSTEALPFCTKCNLVDDQVHAAHCPHEHRGSIGASSGLKAAQKLDPLYEASEASMKYAALSSIHTHRGSVGGASGLEAAEKLDPPEHVRGLEYEQPKPDYHQLTPVYENSFLDMPEVEGESTEDAWKRVVAPATPRFDDRFGKQSNFLEQGEMDEQIEPTCRKSGKSSRSYSTSLTVQGAN